MKRDILEKLKAWKSSPRRKPLILDGARQVGKTYALQTFASMAYAKTVYLNFERDAKLADYFAQELDPHEQIKVLSLHTGIDIDPDDTLIIFDEVQECPRALNSLKYFCEEANQYHVAAAGSLLGVKMSRERGFPVGKVNFLHLYPLSFFEFLEATNHEKLRHYLENYNSFEPIPSPLHEKLLGLLRYYLFIGGMPEAVSNYLQYEKFDVVREVQFEILAAYERDFAKHAPQNQVMKIITTWEQVHRQLAKENKKFIFSAIRKSARGRDFEEAIQWLSDAGLIYKSYQINTPKLPLSAYAQSQIFKLLLLDVGLLGAQSHLSPKTIIEGNKLFTEFKGALTENYIAQELIAASRSQLYYWSSEGTAELDFIVEHDQTIYPLEVKAGNSQKKKSLLVYGNKYKADVLSRATLMNLKHDGAIYNYPLYLISRFPIIESY